MLKCLNSVMLFMIFSQISFAGQPKDGSFSKSIVGKYSFIKEGSFYNEEKLSGDCGKTLRIKYFDDGRDPECKTGVYFSDITFCNVDASPNANAKVTSTIPHGDEITYTSGRISDDTIESFGVFQLKKTALGVDLIVLADQRDQTPNAICKFKKVQ